MERLLEKTRELAKVTARETAQGGGMKSLTRAMADLLGDVTVYVFGNKGEIIEAAIPDGEQCPLMEEGRLSARMAAQVLVASETESFDNTDGTCPFTNEKQVCPYVPKEGVYVPLWLGEERLGTLAVMAGEGGLNEGQLILAEMAAVVLGMTMLNERRRRELQQSRERFMAELAMENLSYTELIAVNAILEELPGREGIVVASRIADRAGITRSIFASALRKLESANVIHTRSLGMKGTYIQILNDSILDLLESSGSQAQPKYA